MKKLIPWGAAGLVFAAHAYWFVRYTIDDAYITFTAARHLAGGLGPVFVPGERVESTSSFLWTVLLAPFELVGIGSVIGSKILGIASALAVIWIAFRLMRTILPQVTDRQLLCGGIMIAATSPFVVWSVYGMEHGMVACLLMLALLLFCRESNERSGWHSAIPIMLLEAARPEGFIFILLFLFLRVAWALGGGNRRRYLLPWLAVLLVPLALYEIGGLLYFGHLLPNTVGAKVDGHLAEHVKRGLLYLVRGRSAVVTYAFVAALVLAVPSLLAAERRFGLAALASLWRRWFGYITVIAVIAMQLLFTTAVGGDWMPNGRFLSHVAPLIVVALVGAYSIAAGHARSVAGILPGIVRSVKVVGVAVMLFYIGYNVHTSERSIHGPVGELQESEDRALGGEVDYLNRAGSANDVVACSDIGRVGYYFKGTVFDWWGLANEEIVHTGQALGNIKAETVLRGKPRFIILYSTQPVLTDSTTNFGMAEYSRPFLASDEFRRSYRQVHSLEFEDSRYHIIFERIP